MHTTPLYIMSLRAQSVLEYCSRIWRQCTDLQQREGNQEHHQVGQGSPELHQEEGSPGEREGKGGGKKGG